VVPKVAKEIVVNRQGGFAELLIDGEPFPFAISADVKTIINSDAMPYVEITIWTDSLVVKNTLSTEE